MRAPGPGDPRRRAQPRAPPAFERSGARGSSDPLHASSPACRDPHTPLRRRQRRLLARAARTAARTRGDRARPTRRAAADRGIAGRKRRRRAPDARPRGGTARPRYGAGRRSRLMSRRSSHSGRRASGARTRRARRRAPATPRTPQRENRARSRDRARSAWTRASRGTRGRVRQRRAPSSMPAGPTPPGVAAAVSRCRRRLRRAPQASPRGAPSVARARSCEVPPRIRRASATTARRVPRSRARRGAYRSCRRPRPGNRNARQARPQNRRSPRGIAASRQRRRGALPGRSLRVSRGRALRFGAALEGAVAGELAQARVGEIQCQCGVSRLISALGLVFVVVNYSKLPTRPV